MGAQFCNRLSRFHLYLLTFHAVKQANTVYYSTFSWLTAELVDYLCQLVISLNILFSLWKLLSTVKVADLSLTKRQRKLLGVDTPRPLTTTSCHTEHSSSLITCPQPRPKQQHKTKRIFLKLALIIQHISQGPRDASQDETKGNSGPGKITTPFLTNKQRLWQSTKRPSYQQHPIENC